MPLLTAVPPAAGVSTKWIVGKNTVHGGVNLKAVRKNRPLAGHWGKGPSGPQGPFPQTPNPLPLFSVAEEEQGKQNAITQN